MTRSDDHTTLPEMSRGLTLLFAVAGGVALGNLYWTQRLLAEIAGSVGVSIGSAGVLWRLDGWPAMTSAAAGLAGLALFVSVSQRSRGFAQLEVLNPPTLVTGNGETNDREA